MLNGLHARHFHAFLVTFEIVCNCMKQNVIFWFHWVTSSIATTHINCDGIHNNKFITIYLWVWPWWWKDFEIRTAFRIILDQNIVEFLFAVSSVLPLQKAGVRRLSHQITPRKLWSDANMSHCVNCLLTGRWYHSLPTLCSSCPSMSSWRAPLYVCAVHSYSYY